MDARYVEFSQMGGMLIVAMLLRSRTDGTVEGGGEGRRG